MRAMTDDFRSRLVGGSLSLLAVVFFGATGYYVLGNGRWEYADCLYMTVITLTTVGYGEVLPDFASVEHARPFTIMLIVMGMGVFLYFASTLTAFIIEGDLRRALQSTRMRKRLSRLERHVIVCGIGSTGSHVVKELIATQTPVIAVDTNEEHLRELAQEFGERFLYVVGDATDDHALEAARLREAGGLVAALASDKDNLYLVVSARQLHPNADEFRIVARGSELNVLAKLQRAGANSVVSPNFIGGMRLASEMIRPSVVKFLDDMLRDQDATRLEDVFIHEGSYMAGRSMRSLDLRNRVNVSVLAVKQTKEGGYIYNPGSDLLLQAGMTLVVLGANQDVVKLRKLAR